MQEESKASQTQAVTSLPTRSKMKVEEMIQNFLDLLTTTSTIE